MKRTSLTLNEHILEEAVRLSGERNYSRTVDRALTELVHRIKSRKLLELGGTGLWKGDLGEMRNDTQPSEINDG